MNPAIKLRRAYESYWPPLCSALHAQPGADELSSPHLIDIGAHDYLGAPTKLMVVGQQTEGWGDDSSWCDIKDSSPETVVQSLLEQYKTFELGKKWRHTRFWSAAHRVFTALNPSGPANGFLWSNLIKMDQKLRRRGNARPSPHLEERICTAFNMLPLEVEIAQPTVLVFFTGPEYDVRLCRCFGSAELQEVPGWNPRQFARVVDHKGILPKHSYRSYHPGFALGPERLALWKRIEEKLCVSCIS